MVQTRVHGISPTEAVDALIRWEWIELAVARGKDPAERQQLLGLPARGVDVANSENGDDAAISRWLGAVCDEVVAFPCPDARILGTQVAAEMAIQSIDVQHVGVDAVGVGASTVNELKRLGLYVQTLHGGPRTSHPAIDEDLLREEGKSVLQEELFRSLRQQMWWQLRMDLQHGRIALPDDPELHQDLLTPTWKTKGGYIWVEPKEDIRERLGRSPNKGDACVYGNWVRHRRAVKEEPAEPLRAWDPEVLAHEALECRRVRSRPPVPARHLDPTIVEWIP